MKRGWGDETYWQFKDQPGSILSGPISRDTIPDTLLHTTTNEPAVKKSGMLIAASDGGGMGGGSGMAGVSFTTSEADANLMETTLKRAIELAQMPTDKTGEDLRAALTRYARQDEKAVGLPEGALQHAVNYSMENWQANIGPILRLAAEEPGSEPRFIRGLSKDAFNAYLTSREHAAQDKLGLQYRVLQSDDRYAPVKNPILYVDFEHFKTLDPANIGTLHVPKAAIPAGALVRLGSDQFLHEIRVHSDVPLRAHATTRESVWEGWGIGFTPVRATYEQQRRRFAEEGDLPDELHEAEPEDGHWVTINGTHIKIGGTRTDTQAVRPKGNQTIRDVANHYASQHGLAPIETTDPGKIDPKEGRRIADAYDAAKSDPGNEDAKKAYAEFNRQIADQADYLRQAGIKAEPWDHPGQPYKNSQEMRDDVRNNGHIYYFKTEAGSPIHALMTPEQNDTFRWVHDVMGHAQSGSDFGPNGEYAAFKEHSKMFYGDALKALPTETLAQNAWFNFSQHNEGRPITTRDFATQKAVVLPEDVWRPHLGAPDNLRRAIKSSREYSPDQPRDDHGRWTGNGHGEWTALSPVERDPTDDERRGASGKCDPGQCYVAAGRYALKHPNATLVHGTIRGVRGEQSKNINHAWVEIGDKVYDGAHGKFYDRHSYYDRMGASAQRRYTGTDTARMMLKTRHFGPWHEAMREYAPEQPRDYHGRWTSNGGAAEGKPGWVNPGPRPRSPSVTSDEDPSAWPAYFKARTEWNAAMGRGVALGYISPKDAIKQEWDSNTLPEYIKPLPETLYHATTDMPTVIREGLKTREELRAVGLEASGLGGGPSSTISFTTDKAYAQRIADVIVEGHDALTGKLTVQDMIDRAKAGDFLGHMQKLAASSVGPWDQIYERKMEPAPSSAIGLGGTLEQVAQRTGQTGWRVTPGAYEWRGGDGQMRATGYERPQTPEEESNYRYQLYKGGFLWAQGQSKGGPENPLIAFENPEYGKRLNPANVGVVEAHPRPGALGYQDEGMKAGEREWRTWSGDAVMVSRATKEAWLRERLLREYSPDQARDEHGRWTAGEAHPAEPLWRKYGGAWMGAYDPSRWEPYRVRGATDVVVQRVPQSQEWTEPTPAEFIAARDKTTRPGFLAVLEPSDLANSKLYLSKDGKTGYAIDPLGDAGNLFNNGGPKGAGTRAVFDAVMNGGRTADCYAGHLRDLYTQVGFVETGRMKFNPEYAHDWDRARYDDPDVVFLAWKGWPDGTRAASEARALNPAEWRAGSKSTKYYDDWDAAKSDARRTADFSRVRENRGLGLGEQPHRPDPRSSPRVADHLRIPVKLTWLREYAPSQPRDYHGRFTIAGIEQAANTSEKDFEIRPPEGFKYIQGLKHEAQNDVDGRTGKIWVGPKFFALPPEVKRAVLYHEVGHHVADEMFRDGSSFDLLDRGHIPKFQNPLEIISDAYSDWHMGGDWKDKYPEMHAAVVSRAKRLGLPMKEAMREYSPDQPRDFHGRWTSGGTAGPEVSPETHVRIVADIRQDDERVLASRRSEQLRRLAEELGTTVPIRYEHYEGPSRAVGDQVFRAGAMYKREAGEIVVFRNMYDARDQRGDWKQLADNAEIKAALAHEVAHAQWDEWYRQARAETQTAIEKSDELETQARALQMQFPFGFTPAGNLSVPGGAEAQAHYQALLDARPARMDDGTVLPSAAKDYPNAYAYQQMVRDPQMAEEDGITPYSKMYWRAPGGKAGGAATELAMNETMAEWARLEAMGANMKVVAEGKPRMAEIYTTIKRATR